jgi:predicted amidohydrolase
MSARPISQGRPPTDREVVVGIAQWLPHLDEPAESLDEAVAFIRKLAEERCDLAVLPELWPCAHDPADVAALADKVHPHAEPLDGPRNRALARVAAEHRLWLAAGSVPEHTANGIFNTALLFSPDGELRAAHRKAHLYAPMHENLVFSPGECLTVVDTELLGRVGLVVCYDGDFPEVARALRIAGARIVLQVDAYEEAAESWWDRIYPAHALINGQWWVMANQCGTRGSTTFLGGSQIVSPLGDIVAKAPRAKPGQTPEPVLLVQQIQLDALIRRADEEAAALVDQRRPELRVRKSGGDGDRHRVTLEQDGTRTLGSPTITGELN